jgi:hypothetical protein
MAAAGRNATVNTGYATIITPIAEGHAEALKYFLRTEVEPRFAPDEPREILKCRSRFPFDKIGTLHFCSFAVLDGDPEFRPCLVFEATFDGSLDRFLDELLEVAAGAIDEIYQHCEGYPASGSAIPELVKKYLARHDEGAHTFYFGSPGRTVAQIKGEAQIYDALASSICQPWSRQKAMPATFAGILQELRDVISNQPGYRWEAQHMTAVPWEVAWRKAVPVAVVLPVLGATCLLVALVVRLSGICEPIATYTAMPGGLLCNPMDIKWADDLVEYLHLSWLVRFSEFSPNMVNLSIYLQVLLLIVVWVGLRFIEFLLRSLFKDPRQENFWLRVLFHILIILRYFFVMVFIWFSVLVLDEDAAFEDEPSTVLLRGPFPWEPSPVYAILMLIGAGSVFLLFQHWATSLKLAVQFQELDPAPENLRRWAVDMLRVGMVVVAAFALLVLSRSSRLLVWLEGTFYVKITAPTMALLKLAVYAFVGLIAAQAIGCLLFVGLRIMERYEARRFSDAEGLAAFDNSSVYAREEGGINTYQNHLVSLTYVKPGVLRALCLRLTLFVVGLLSRFWYNKGELGGIPTILSARWVLIDGGKRLLFLDHYSGAWNNYLNEFIDMTAVFGLNAIWTSTFIKVRGSQYGFPETEYYFWKGAQVERPFKAYVRHSQIETLAWYSAYPTVFTVNVNTNTEVMRSLFKSSASCEIDSLLQNL